VLIGGCSPFVPGSAGPGGRSRFGSLVFIPAILSHAPTAGRGDGPPLWISVICGQLAALWSAIPAELSDGWGSLLGSGRDRAAGEGRRAGRRLGRAVISPGSAGGNTVGGPAVTARPRSPTSRCVRALVGPIRSPLAVAAQVLGAEASRVARWSCRAAWRNW
jgi:hypothetical protein